MKNLLLLLTAILAECAAFSQSTIPTENTLLWRISGKGLDKPSYLFGTMHLTDERVFNLSDSLLIAIEKSEGFAIELDPDEMMTVMMEEMFNDFKKSRMLKDVVSKKAFDKYSPMLSKRLKKDVDDITVKDVVQEQNSWMKDSYSKGSMPTFLDVWLYDIARKQGKWVGGVEDIEDQTGLMEDIFNEQDLEFLTVDYDKYGKAVMDSMINRYALQDINMIDAMSSDEDPDRKDKLLLNRNVKMASRMDSLSAVRTMVFAVGAAHLPGQGGVIDLLRQKGFTVEPVFSDKRIAAKNYKVEAKPIPWQKASDAKGYFDVEFPGKASSLKLYGFYEIMAHVNLFNSSSYMVMAIPSSVDMKNPDRQLLELARKISANKSLKQGRTITKNGLAGREYFVKVKDGNERIQLFYSPNALYLAATISMKDAEVDGKDPEHFFSSLTLHQMDTKAIGTYSLADKFPGIEGETPVALELNEELTGQANELGFENKMYAGIDQKTGGIYMLGVKNTTLNFFLPNDSLYLVGMGANMRSRFNDLLYDSLMLENDRFKIEQKGVEKSNKLYVHLKGYADGNRVYTLMAIVPDNVENRNRAAQVMQTFKSVPVFSLGWDSTQVEPGHLSAWAPAAFHKVEKDSTEWDFDKSQNFVAKDSLTSYSYFVMRSPFEETDWFNDEEAFWEKRFENITEDYDSIYNKTAFEKDGIRGYDIDIRHKIGSGKMKYYRMFLYGDTLYTLFTSLPVSMKDDPDSKRFFTEFRFSKQPTTTTLFTSKAKTLLESLSSNDSATRTKAYAAVNKADFASVDIPLLRTALLKHYDLDTETNYYREIHTLLLAKLSTLNDSTLADYIKEHYSKAELNAEEQTIVLTSLLDKPTEGNFRFALNELEKVNDTASIPAYNLYALDDSIALAANFKQEILHLLKKQNMSYQVLNIANILMDSNVVAREDVLPYEDNIIALGDTYLKSIDESDNDVSWKLNEVALMAGRLKTEKSKALLAKIIQVDDKDVLIDAVRGLLLGEMEIPTSIVDKLAGDPNYRYDLYQELKKAGKANLFPKKYATQTAMAEAAVYYYLQDDDRITNTGFLGTKKAQMDGKEITICFFKTDMGEDEDSESYLTGIAFPSKESLDPIENMVGAYWDEVYNPKQKNKQMEALINQLKTSNID